MKIKTILFGTVVLLIALHCLTSVPYARAEESEVSSGGEENPPVIEKNIESVPAGSVTDSETEIKEKDSLKRSGEKFQFQAEVSRLMDIIINSLYSNKDIFLRELISNASDALDKIRFLSLTEKEVLGEGENTKLEIQIKLDPEKKILTIRDRGIGMTKEDLIKNLGTIAKSGTSAFLEQVQKGGDLNLIGQFGVGFYSVYLVADYVEVHSKHNDDKQWVWASKADGNFEVYEDEDSEPLGRGTEIRIYLKEEAGEYSNQDKLKELVKKYSQFINFPISLWASKEVEVEAPDEEEEVEETEADEEDKPEEEEESTEETTEKKEKKTVKETQWNWELLNDVKAIWLRSPKDVTDEEYEKFYSTVAKDYSVEKPIAWTHFSAEGDVEFKAILFIPPRAPADIWDNYYSSAPALKLFVRRVFISDQFDQLLPRYLNFLKGLVDSDSLPLNVSREMLQQHGSLKTMKKKLIRKALDLIRKIAEEDEDETRPSGSEDSTDEESTKDASKKGKYAQFWKEFGKSIKLGVIEDSSNRVRLAKLLRFQSSKSDGKSISLDDYVARMKEGQKHIYYITGPSVEQLKKSPFLEKLLKEDYEVLYMTDAVDEYLMQNLTEYEDRKFQNASKDDLKIGDKKKKDKALKDTFKDLLKWWKTELGDKTVEDVKLSDRLASSPCVVVTSKYGWSANMERIMNAQALSDTSKQSYMRGRRTLEINPRHPIIKELRELVARDPEDASTKETARLLFETALLESGFELSDPSTFAKRVYSTLQSKLDIPSDAALEEEIEEPEVEESTKGEEDESKEGVEDVKIDLEDAKDEGDDDLKEEL